MKRQYTRSTKVLFQRNKIHYHTLEPLLGPINNLYVNSEELTLSAPLYSKYCVIRNIHYRRFQWPFLLPSSHVLIYMYISEIAIGNPIIPRNYSPALNLQCDTLVDPTPFPPFSLMFQVRTVGASTLGSSKGPFPTPLAILQSRFRPDKGMNQIQ